MLITDIKDKWFKGHYNHAIKFSSFEELEKFIAYIKEDTNRYDKLFGSPYSEPQILSWRSALDINLKKKRFRFISIRYSGACYNGQNTTYLDSTKIKYNNTSTLSYIDKMLDMITMYEKKEEMSDTEKEIRSILDELAL